MQDPIAEISTALNSFLSGYKSKIKEMPEGQALVNFISPIKDFPFHSKLDNLLKLFPRSFYFENPSENFSFLALDEIFTISENGDGRFAATEKKLKGWREKLLSNHQQFMDIHFPLFVGGMKFTVEHSDDDWKEFNDSTWFVPEVVIVKKDDKYFLIFNSLVNATASEDKTVKKLKSKLDIILKIENDISKNHSVKAINGTSPKEKKKWKNIVQKVIDKLNDGLLQKAVISRQVEIQLNDEPSISLIINKLKSVNGLCYLFIYKNGKSSFFGASPELLLRLKNEMFYSGALAGSSNRGINESEDDKLASDLLSDSKNLFEHNLVVNHITTSFKNFTGEDPITEKLSVKKLTNIQHLFTSVSCRNNGGSNIFSLVKDLFPTPAVCGVPKDTALNIIEDLETEQRGLYSGIIGWFNFDGTVELVVGIRSALSTGTKILAYAGAGIVADSNPDEEYKETETKLKSILSVFSDHAKS